MWRSDIRSNLEEHCPNRGGSHVASSPRFHFCAMLLNPLMAQAQSLEEEPRASQEKRTSETQFVFLCSSAYLSGDSTKGT